MKDERPIIKPNLNPETFDENQWTDHENRVGYLLVLFLSVGITLFFFIIIVLISYFFK